MTKPKTTSDPKEPVSAYLAAGGSSRSRAFTRGDLVVVLGVVALLASLAISAGGQGRTRSLQAICVGNLRTVGQALGLFNADHGGFDPWLTPEYSNPPNQNAWYQFSLLSNYTATPQVFACPADEPTRPAREFSSSADGGLLNPRYLNNAISYVLGLDSSSLQADSLLAADRNLRCASWAAECSGGYNPVGQAYVGWYAGWDAGSHGPAGNLLLHDGRVEQASSDTAGRAFNGSNMGRGSRHILAPRR